MDFRLSDTARSDLKTFQRNVSDRSSYVKVTTLLLLDKGLPIAEISDYLGIDDSTVYRYRKAYDTDGLARYLETDYAGYWGRLSCWQLSELRTELNGTLYTDSKQVAAWIAQRWAIHYTPEGIADLLNRLGFSYKKTTCVPCEADFQKQVDFLQKLDGLLQESAGGESVVYFADGVHPTHNTRSTHAWIEKGTQRQQPTVSGRDRVNINAVVNASQPTEVFAQECPSVNADSTRQLYEQVLRANPDKKTIYIISDNARYYKNKVLAEWVKTTRITPVFLPPYSPNLNLIERLWKLLRKKVINTHFYRRKEEFRQAVMQFFQNIGLYRQELASLMTLNFHVLNSQFSF